MRQFFKSFGSFLRVLRQLGRVKDSQSLSLNELARLGTNLLEEVLADSIELLLNLGPWPKLLNLVVTAQNVCEVLITLGKHDRVPILKERD